MNRVQIVSLMVVLLLAGLVVYMAIRADQPPILSPGEQHEGFLGPDDCMICHGADGVLPQSKNHPLRTDCLDCHGLP